MSRETSYSIDKALYHKINELPGCSSFELSKALKWPIKKINGSLKRLETKGLIRLKNESRSGKQLFIAIPLEWPELAMKPEDAQAGNLARP